VSAVRICEEISLSSPHDDGTVKLKVRRNDKKVIDRIFTLGYYKISGLDTRLWPGKH